MGPESTSTCACCGKEGISSIVGCREGRICPGCAEALLHGRAPCQIGRCPLEISQREVVNGMLERGLP